MHVTPNQEVRYLANENEENFFFFLNMGAQQTVKPILGRQTLRLSENEVLGTDEGAENALK